MGGQRPVSRQGRKKNFSGPKKFYFLSPEAGQQARKEKKLFRPQKVLFSIARGRSAGKEGKETFQAPFFFFYHQRPVSRQGRKKNFSGPKKCYFLSLEAGQQARKEKKLFRPHFFFSITRGRSAGKEGKQTFQAPKSFILYRQRPVSRQGRKKNFSGPKKCYFLSPEAGQQARKEKHLFRPQTVLFSITRGRSAGKEVRKTFQAPKSFILYRQRPVSRQGRKKNFSGPKKCYFLSLEAGQQERKEKKKSGPKKFYFYRQRPVSRQGRKNHFSGPKKFYFLSPEAGQQARKEKKLFRPQKVLFSIARCRSAGKEGKKTFQAPKSFIFYRQRPASWVDDCRSSRIQSCSRRALHLCDNVRDVTTQAQEVQRPIRLRFSKSLQEIVDRGKKLFGS